MQDVVEEALEGGAEGWGGGGVKVDVLLRVGRGFVEGSCGI
jgi:hypothetical protein